MQPGLVSVTFRKETPQSIVALCVANGLEAIEWGGDIHVPHGDLTRAEEVASLTNEAGLSVAAYGSYYRLGVSESDGLSFASVLQSAVALGAPSIRVWAGNRDSGDADSAWRSHVANDALRCADLSGAEGISIAYEFHGGTLTDTVDSACALLDATVHPFVYSNWQPPVGMSTEDCLTGLHRIMPRLLNVHAFHWWPDAATRQPLSVGADRWTTFLDTIRTAGRTPSVLLEFVRGDAPAALAEDAATLRCLLNPAT